MDVQMVNNEYYVQFEVSPGLMEWAIRNKILEFMGTRTCERKSKDA